MSKEHEIVSQVYLAKENSEAADALVRQYLPFIKAETAKFTHHIPREGEDDELSIAMFAFHEAVLAYSRVKGAFLSFAATAIRNRLIDYVRKEQRHQGLVSLDQPRSDGEDDRSLMEELDTGADPIAERTERTAARTEILEFVTVLKGYGLSATDIADNCPRQERTLSACHQALAYAKANPALLDALVTTGRLPLAQLAGVERKTLERHRKYMVALLLAYTNGFEIIRGHIQQVARLKEGQRI